MYKSFTQRTKNSSRESLDNASVNSRCQTQQFAQPSADGYFKLFEALRIVKLATSPANQSAVQGS